MEESLMHYNTINEAYKTDDGGEINALQHN